MRRLVTYVCGDTQLAHIISTSPRTREEIVQQLQRSFCPACQRKCRYTAAYQCAVQAGLLPLQSGCTRQLALAEIVRATLWHVLLPSGADIQARQLLAALFNRQLHASFWTSLRGWAMDRLDPEQAGQVLLRLLHTT